MTSARPGFDSVAPVFPDDYVDRVYAGLLGKVIGVYAGRPIEQWTYDRIRSQVGNVRGYVNEVVGEPLVVSDDDITGTCTFIRAAADSGRGYDTDAGDVAEAWLNYLIEGRSVLWWGGLGNSTEHTAFLRLKKGHRPPESGSADLNGKVVSEQIGAQIFIDGWAMIAPGAPQLAATMAEQAARVSHDGEAVYAAQALAAMESAAFLPSTIDDLLDVALATVPQESLIAQLISDIRRWHSEEPDWRVTRESLDQRYGYHLFGGGCHVIPNHGLIILALLYGGGDFARSMDIVNTAGWDTDCNAGSLGALLGIWGGLSLLNAGPDWRGPVADRIYLPTADSGGGISDVLTEASRIAEIGYASAGIHYDKPKDGARFHFSSPGSVQGFSVGDGDGAALNVPWGESRALRILALGTRASVSTPTFLPVEMIGTQNYPVDVSPTLYSGQRLRARVGVAPDAAPQEVQLFVRVYDAGDRLTELFGPAHVVSDQATDLEWVIPDTEGQPIHSVGLIVHGELGVDVHLDRLTWGGAPQVTFKRPVTGGSVWKRAWARATDCDPIDEHERFRLVHNEGRGYLLTGTQDWSHYAVTAHVQPHAASAVGVMAAVRGLRNYVAIRWSAGGNLSLIRRAGDRDIVLAETMLPWGDSREMTLVVDESRIVAAVDGEEVLRAESADIPRSGGIGLFVDDGRTGVDHVTVTPSAIGG